METDSRVISLSEERSKRDDKKIGGRPWLDESGVIRSDPVLRDISILWSADTWELFLVETVEGSSSYQREDLINPCAYAGGLDEMTRSIWECVSSQESDDLLSRIRRYIRDHLTARQQQIIRLTFWDGLSERAAGEVIGVGRSTVAVQKRRSFKKLKKLIEMREPNLFLDKRGRLKSEAPVKSRDEQIRDVYHEEITNLYGQSGGG